MAAFDAEPFLAGLTTRPGVYRMLGDAGTVLYVGKARNLRARVTAYFRASGLTAKTMALVAKVRDIQVTVTSSETEALLLEQSLIKTERPPYNVVLRDDKSYPYIHLTEHPYPRLAFHRGARKEGRYFGPFPSAAAVRDSLNILQKLFGIRPCEDGFFKNRSRPCLQHQIDRCSAPCVGLIDRERYAEDVRLAVMFLEGKSQDVLAEFKAKMEAAAESLEFERAARYRDQIAHLRRVQENQYVHGAGGDVDIFGIAPDSDEGAQRESSSEASAGGGAGAQVCIQGLFVRDGRLLGHRTWFPRNELAMSGGEMLFAFLSQYYLGTGNREIPKSVIASASMAEADLLAKALSDRVGRRVEVASRVRGQRARWAKMAADNAEISLSALLADRENIMSRFVALQSAIEWEDLPKRVECFDISHAAGESTVASCVVFDSEGPVKSDYRRFNIEGVARGDDYGAIEQTIKRRYSRLAKGEGTLPDVVVIDGGIGQVNRAAEVLKGLHLDNIALLGIAKGPTRRPGLETIVLAGGDMLALPANGPAMHLLQQVRDEAHRFAIAGHRGRRQKRQRRSALDDIPGIGPRRKRELLAHFGSVSAISGASREEISKVPGISRKLAVEIHGSLHGR
ncbi:MAG: excinuclease ABC subunit UvrC [Gammaproteobacteria bacterium]|nr:excinuclease ABC subunit UvrC [Gammaproteobacteria bacterium]